MEPLNIGISSRQGAHHVAQKSTSLTFPPDPRSTDAVSPRIAGDREVRDRCCGGVEAGAERPGDEAGHEQDGERDRRRRRGARAWRSSSAPIIKLVLGAPGQILPVPPWSEIASGSVGPGLRSCARREPDPPRAASPRLKDLSLEELANIEVTTPGKAPESAFRAPAAVYVLTQDEIRRSGATNIPEALRLVPGSKSRASTPTKWAIGIRGFATRLSKGVLVPSSTGAASRTPLFAGVYWEAQDVRLQTSSAWRSSADPAPPSSGLERAGTA